MLKENCISCLQSITNPVCENCYMKQVERWLEHIDLKESSKNLAIKEIKKNIVVESLNEQECILCGKNSVSICSYCFFDKSSRILKKVKFTEEFIQNFLATFSYPLEK